MVHLFAALVFCCVATGGHSAESPDLPNIYDPDFIQRCVKAHNQHRSNVTPPASDMQHMTWDEALAKTASAWAKFCQFEHNPRLNKRGQVHPNFTSVGENIWVSTNRKFSVEGALKLWYNEVAHYTYTTNQCTKVCGHYTQVVWATSYKVGCSVQLCPQGIQKFHASPQSVIFVCNYGDAGNMVGQQPYKTGRACSKCRGDICQNNLCRNAERDKLRTYSWSPQWDPDRTSCSSFCSAVLVIRPVSILLIFSVAFGLHYLYPNMFAYE